jgi:hypothetical protein
MMMIGMIFQWQYNSHTHLPQHHLAKVPSFGVKQLDFVDHVALTKSKND